MSDSQFIVDRLEHIVNEFVQHEAFIGLSIGVVKDGKSLYAKGFGTKNLATGEPNDANTLFHQASLSKTLVATAIMQLVDRGMLELESPITLYLPYFTMADERYLHITIRQLMNHTSGMPDEEDYGWDRPEYDEQSLERYIRSISNLVLIDEPGARFAYSNIGYEILGDIIAKLSGMSFEQYMKTYILEPVGMQSSSFLKQEVNDLLATPHILAAKDGYGGVVSDIFPYNRAHGPSSTLYASAEDMSRYAAMHINKGNSENGQIILPAHCYDEMWQQYALTGNGEDSSGMGLGWFLGTYKGFRLMSHTGMDTGFHSILLIIPDKGIALSVMANSDYVWMPSISFSIIDLLLGTDVQHVKFSLAHHLSKFSIANSVEATIDEYNRINSQAMDRYYFWENELTFIAGNLVNNGYSEDAITVLTFSAQLFPDSAPIHNFLAELQNKQTLQ